MFSSPNIKLCPSNTQSWHFCKHTQSFEKCYKTMCMEQHLRGCSRKFQHFQLIISCSFNVTLYTLDLDNLKPICTDLPKSIICKNIIFSIFKSSLIFIWMSILLKCMSVYHVSALCPLRPEGESPQTGQVWIIMSVLGSKPGSHAFNLCTTAPTHIFSILWVEGGAIKSSV